jgi:hypothetical protein
MRNKDGVEQSYNEEGVTTMHITDQATIAQSGGGVFATLTDPDQRPERVPSTRHARRFESLDEVLDLLAADDSNEEGVHTTATMEKATNARTGDEACAPLAKPGQHADGLATTRHARRFESLDEVLDLLVADDSNEEGARTMATMEKATNEGGPGAAGSTNQRRRQPMLTKRSKWAVVAD